MVRNIARLIFHGFSTVFTIIVCAFFTWGLIGHIAFDRVSLGPRFGLTVVVTIVASICVVIISRLLIIRASDSLKRWGEHFPSWSRSNKKKLIVGSLAIFLLILSPTMSSFACERISRAIDAESARQVFAIVGNSATEPGSTEYTLAEFERARRRLEGQWPIPENSLPILLHFFRDINEYHSAIGADWSAGALSCRETRITIFIPLEEVPEIFVGDEESHTPLHEMVHAMICQSIGKRAHRSIPSWFHEGIAEFHEHESSSHSKRVSNRFKVWLSRQDLMNPDRFCDYIPPNNRAEIALFYATAGEFVHSLATGHGSDTLNAIVEDIGAGVAFEDSLRSFLGGTCIGLYSEWSRSL